MGQRKVLKKVQAVEIDPEGDIEELGMIPDDYREVPLPESGNEEIELSPKEQVEMGYVRSRR